MLLLSGVQYYTGQLFDVPKITAYAQSKVGYGLYYHRVVRAHVIFSNLLSLSLALSTLHT